MNGEAKTEVIKQRLEWLASKGPLTPQAVVKDAQKDTSPLHGEFEWDDAKAGYRWRIRQARRLIASVRLTVVNEERIVSTVAYVRDPAATTRQPGYVKVTELQDDKARALTAMITEVGRIDAYLQRLRSLSAALGLQNEVDVMLADLLNLRLAIERLEAA